MQAKPQPEGPTIQPLPFPAELPMTPREVQKRFPKMTAWNDDMQTWWTDVRRLLSGVQSQIFKKINDNNNSTSKEIKDVGAQVVTAADDMDVVEGLFYYQNFV